MSELLAGLERAAEVVPRESASTIVLRPAVGGCEVLLGVRSRNARFMPGQWAFPGGGLDAEDRPTQAGAFARCAARELVEESGLDLAAERFVPVGERTTPPMFPVRFHTHFHLVEVAADLAVPEPATEEIERFDFVKPAALLAHWRSGAAAVPPPVLSLLRALADSGGDPLDTIAETLRRSNAQEQRAARIEFVPGLWVLPVRTATMPPATTTNVWIPGGERFVVIDPGSSEAAEQARLLEVIERRTALGARPLAVLLTHRHRDHIAGLSAICCALDVPVRAHPELLASSLLDGVRKGEPLQDGDSIDLGGLELRVWHTPGHAPDHLAFEVVDRGWLIVGDLISGISTILIDPEHGDMGDYIASLQRMHDRRYRTLFPGHGPPIPARALGRLIEHRRRREAFVLDQLVGERVSLSRVARGAYSDLPQLPPALIELQTLAHLIDLERRGAVRRVEGDREWERS